MKTIKSLTRLALFALGLSALAVGSAFAATNVGGTIVGEVSTTDGDTVANATVTITNPETGFSRTLNTSADGEFRFPALSIGEYTLTIEESGLQTVTRQVTVNVGSNTDVYVTMLGQGESAAELGTVTVTGAAISPIDISSTTSELVIDEATIDRIPVARNLTAVALLAPTAVSGDNSFGNLPSIGGATVGENQYYINGLNVTEFRNGLGFSTVPFEFFQQFEVKVGGYSAMYGRSTGGVINAVTKSGTNDFQWGASLYWEPWIEDFNGNAPDTHFPVAQSTLPDDDDSDTNPEFTVVPGGEFFETNQRNEEEEYSLALWASGPIIEDSLFYYVLFNPREETLIDKDGAGTQLLTDRSSDDAFYGIKLDWFITDNHKLELTAFSDERTITDNTYEYVYATDTTGDFVGTSVSKRGGENFILQYTGYITSNFTASVSYGENEYSLVDTLPGAILSEPLAVDSRVNPPVVTNNPLGGGPYATLDLDTREQTRLDFEWFLGDHLLHFGYENSTLTSKTNSEYSGGVFYDIDDFLTSNPGFEVLEQIYRVQGEFETVATAIYIEDQWQVTDTLLLSLGLRNETFENKNKLGQTFVEQKNQIAPRLGASWDVMGDGSFKLFANYGRYYLPVANNTNVRLTGGEFFVQNYYEFPGTFDGGQPTGNIPDLGTFISANQLSNGIPPDPRIGVDQSLDPMFQDEFILGFSADVGNGWVVGLRGMYRDLGSTIDDITIDEAINQPGAFNYVLANPGEDVTVFIDANGDSELTGSELTPVTLTAEELGYPESVRKYVAWIFDFEKVWNGEWYLQGSYVWSHSYGNNEGYVRSDNGQADAGLTVNWDFAGLLDGAYGDLPNDRRHTFKIRGAWKFAEHWTVSSNVLMRSGRPKNAFGTHPTDIFSALYGANSLYQNGVLVPRGSRGTTPFITQVDLGLNYMTEIGAGDLTLGLDIFNIFNATNAIEIQNEAETGVAPFTLGPGSPVYSYGLPTTFQTPRYLRLSAEIAF